MTTTAVRAAEDESPEPAQPSEARRPARRLLDRVLVFGAGGTALLMLGGLLISLVTLFAMRHPYNGWSDNVVADAKAVATGHYQYGNPVTHPVGAGYTPLYTWMFAALLRVFWWEGWGAVISMLAIAAALGAVIAMIWTQVKGWEGRLATASFVVVIALGGLSAFDPNGVYEARPDQLAWCCFVIAGTILFRGYFSTDGLSRRQLIAIGLLLAASVLAKQPTLIPCLVVAGGTLVAPRPRVAHERVSWRARFGWAAAPVVFVGLLAVVGIALQLTSDGYAYPILVTNGFRVGRYIALRQELSWDLRRMAVPLAAFGIVAVSAAVSLYSRRRDLTRRQWLIGVAAVLVAACPFPTSILAAIKMGGNFNQLIGPLWALVLGAGVLLMLMQPSGRQLVASAVVCAVLVVGLGVLPHSLLDDKTGKPALDQRNQWVSTSPYLYAAVDRGEAVYDWSNPGLSVSKDATRYPAGDWVDRFAAGYTPRYFIRNLLDGRYALVAPLPTDSVNTTYWSGLERYDASIAWKMNLLLTYAYDPVQDPATGAFYFEPGPKLSEFGWFADCFGPWEARDAGVAVRVRGSGGLVCAAKGQLGLSQAPAPSTTLVATLREGEGDATVRVAGPPTLLQVTRLNDQDEIAAAPESAAVVQSCLATEGKGRALTLRAVDGDGDWTCRTGNDGPVLELPVGKGGTAHVALDVAAADSPAITASSSDGSYTPFVVANPTPN